MISVEGLRVEFSARALIEDASFVINARDRIALVGKNGAGKSTLLRILNGEQQPSSGTVSVPRGVTVGYLPQVMRLADETTVREEARKAFANIDEQRRRVDCLQRGIDNRTDYDSDDYMALLEKFSAEHERLIMMGSDSMEAEMERTLAGLGFLRADFDRPTCEFSGGWRMRIELAKLLLLKPDVLLLDEPTNHLDIESIQWLEQWLRLSAKAVILVSHDRAFINNVTERTLEISCRRIVDYKVKYGEFVKLRRERREQQQRAWENQQREIEEAKAFIGHFRYKASKAVQVQQKVRQLEKMVPVEIDEIDTSALHLKFPPCLRSGDYPIMVDSVEKSYGAHKVFSDVTFTLKRGEKVAFVGKNGEGKSTLVKCIMQEIPFNGTLKIGHNVQLGYFAQNQAQLLDESLTVFQTIDNVATGEIRLRIKDILGAFMFGGEAADKKVEVLSGGERSRLAMIKLLLEPVNLLILDEPTNHLDMRSKDVLKEAIKAFDGTAIIVSHDREFLDGLVERVYEFAGGKVREHIGGIYDFLKVQCTTCSVQPQEDNKGTKASDSARRVPAVNAASYEERKERQRRLNRLQKSVRESEDKIGRLEERIKELDNILCDPENASNIDLIHEYADLRRLIDEEELRWTSLAEQLEENVAKIHQNNRL